MLVFLVVLTVTFFGLTLYSIIQENLNVFNIRNPRFFALKIFNIESSASLFVTMLGALLVRNQFVLGLRPRISYKSCSIIKESTPEKIWQVKLYNSGLGGAIINLCEFELETSIEKSGSLVRFENVVKHLGNIGLVHEEDYWLENISSGFTLPPKEDYIVFEIKAAHIDKIKRLNMLLHFQGFLGDKYYRSVVLIPKA